jgi:hypothetical protein
VGQVGKDQAECIDITKQLKKAEHCNLGLLKLLYRMGYEKEGKEAKKGALKIYIFFQSLNTMLHIHKMRN